MSLSIGPAIYSPHPSSSEPPAAVMEGLALSRDMSLAGVEILAEALASRPDLPPLPTWGIQTFC